MGVLYTVRMKRKIIVKKPEGEELRLVDEVYHDLPLAAAHRYREKFGDQVVSIEPTRPEFKQRRPPGSVAAREKFYAEGSGRTNPFERKAEARKKRAAKIMAATKPAGYADLVNTMMKGSA